ncbi:MAG TPA: hypothetical protein VEA92_02615 [Candidatus Paceibacterota bacterium]|nr:hypothetical protein [Candidatus Paceibacterota bacterium]
MASTLSIIWARLIHDLGLYEHEFTVEEIIRHHEFGVEDETPEEQQERLHTEVGGISIGQQL